MQKVGWTVCFLYMYCFTELYHMRFRWSLRLAIGVQMHDWCHRSIFLCFVQRSAQFWKCLQVYCGSSRLKPQLKLSSVRVRKKHLATPRNALMPKLGQNLQQPYASWRNLWSILELTLTRLRVGLDQTCVELYSGDAFGGEVDPVFLRKLAIANKRSDSMPSIDSVLHVCVTSKWLMLA